MTETTEPLFWALVVLATSLGADGKQLTTYSAPDFYETAEKCKAKGEHLLSVIDMMPGVSVEFACIPREMLRSDLSLYSPADEK